MANQSHPTAAEKALGDFSPKLVRLTDDVLFADIWERSAHSRFRYGDKFSRIS
jgi:4-carboxymuconolactone decarboxylase